MAIQLFWENGKSNGNYYRYIEVKIGIMENKMETTIGGILRQRHSRMRGSTHRSSSNKKTLARARQSRAIASLM